MSELERVAATAHALAEAISRRDGDAVARFLTPDFVLRSPGKTATGRSAFAAGILELPDGIEFVKLRDLEIDLDGDHALVTGLQHARVRIDAQNIDDIRPFVDCLRAGNDSGDVCPDSVAVIRRKLAEVDECVDRLTTVRTRLSVQLDSAIRARTRGES